MPNLPAPYTSPWREFGRNLRAVLADLGLRIRELSRRNREGDLSVPAFWPPAWAPFFWPLLLALVLALPAAGLRWLSLSRSVEAPVEQLGDGPSTSTSQSLQATAADELVTSALPGDSLGSDRDDAAPSPSIGSSAEQSIPPPSVLPAPPALQIDPLLNLMIDGDTPDNLLESAEPDLRANRLVLRVSRSGWQALTAGSRQEQAETWQSIAEDLGYGSLTLLDDEDRSLGRSARVGDGMILFDVEVS